MREWVIAALFLTGCQSAPPMTVTVNPSPPSIATSQLEPRQEKTLNRPPAERAKDLAPPTQRYVPESTSRDPVRQRESEVPRPPAAPTAQKAPVPSPSAPSIQRVPTLLPPPTLPPSYPTASVEPTALAPQSGYLPRRPTPGRPEVTNFPRPHLPGQPALARAPQVPGAVTPRPPRWPGQSHSTTRKPSQEHELEQAYLQSRADALNEKYHRGRPVLNAHSPEVQSSAQAPPMLLVQPSLPGQNSVVEAFRKSEHHRQEWQQFRQSQRPQPGGSLPSVPR